jgi:hypothetical protein
MPLETGRQRVIIEGVQPEINGGRYPIKRTVGEQVQVEADIFTDGHDALTAVLLCRTEKQQSGGKYCSNRWAMIAGAALSLYANWAATTIPCSPGLIT